MNSHLFDVLCDLCVLCGENHNPTAEFGIKHSALCILPHSPRLRNSKQRKQTRESGTATCSLSRKTMPTRRQSTPALDGAFMPPAPRLPSTPRMAGLAERSRPPGPAKQSTPYFDVKVPPTLTSNYPLLYCATPAPLLRALQATARKGSW